MSFVESSLNSGGTIKPLIINDPETQGTGLCNPSVFIHGNKLYTTLRHVQYMLYHSEKEKTNHPWGPLLYFHPENDVTLTTKNYFCELDKNLDVKNHALIDTSKLDVKPIWDFIGLEDARLVNWNDEFYLCGVRRDTTPNGVGRMEISKLDIKTNKEVSRNRIEPPNNARTYCEKNWMPILDKPFHFVKWTNPTEVVKVNIENNTSETVSKSEPYENISNNLRGGSHVIPYKNGYLCIVHEAYLWYNELNRKNSRYTHRLIYWDSEFNLIKISKEFNFMGGEIEFCCGLSEYNDEYLITFGFQDNAAFILKTTENVIEEYLND
jgi:predicted GH43/DUF377 family glycosyl hydrolase